LLKRDDISVSEFVVAVLYVDVDYARERRIVEASAFLKLRAVKAFVVVVDDKFDYWIFGGGKSGCTQCLVSVCARRVQPPVPSC